MSTLSHLVHFLKSSIPVSVHNFLKKKMPKVRQIFLKNFWLALLNQFRTFDWASEYKYPTVLLSQMNQLLAECKEG